MPVVRPLSRASTADSSNSDTVLLLPEGGLELIQGQLKMGRYLQRRQRLFLFCGVAIIVIRVVIMLSWILIGHFHNVTASAFMAAGSIAEIASASFLITIGCKPMRWVASRVLSLSIFCAMGNLSAGFASIGLLYRTGQHNELVFGWIALSFHVLLCLIFIVAASYAGYALQCSVCCTLEDEDISDQTEKPMTFDNPSLDVDTQRRSIPEMKEAWGEVQASSNA